MNALRVIFLICLWGCFVFGAPVLAGALADAKPGMAVEKVTNQKLLIRLVNMVGETRTWSASLKPMIGEVVLAEQTGYQFGENGEAFNLPKLDGGQYRLELVCEDGLNTYRFSRHIIVDLQGVVWADIDVKFLFTAVKGKRVIKLVSLVAPPEYTQWRLSFRKMGEAQKIINDAGPLPFKPKGRWATTYDLPELALGQYLVEIQLDGAGDSIAIQTVVKAEIDFRYAYFPSRNMLRAYLPDQPGLAGRTHWKLTLKPHQQETVLVERMGTLPFPDRGESIPAPKLPLGDYDLTFTVTGEGEPMVINRRISRLKHDWESLGADLGTDDIVIPPFTPLQVTSDTRQVDCVLRTHTMAQTGLWDQVVSRSQSLLVEPIQLEASVSGTKSVASGSRLSFLTQTPTRVAGTAAWKAGTLGGSTSFEFDYDGLMKVTLDIEPCDQVIDSFKLRIPMQPDVAKLIHPVTVGLRNHYAGRIPAGAGKVWDSLTVDRQGLTKPFVPYILIGNIERGICWLAENDRGWVLDASKPAMEIHRDDDSVDLVLNLFMKPTKVETSRQIVFYLQATPTKPMPQKPYPWRSWYTNVPGFLRGGLVSLNMWGGTQYWGARHMVQDYFPAEHDYRFFDELRKGRSTGKLDSAYLEQRLTPYKDDIDFAHLKSHWKAGLGFAAYTPFADPSRDGRYNAVMPYTSPRSCGFTNDGFRSTYVDEWSQVDVADPSWNALPRATRERWRGIWYNLEPIQSYADMALYYQKKMLETFADGLYWDNIFLQPVYIPAEAGGPGYVDDDGNLRPGVNILAFRNLAKRAAIMMHQMGKPPMIWMHMTNFNVVPILSFATVNYDWEWRDLGPWAVRDAQDRLGKTADSAIDLIHIMSTGIHSGNVSVACDRFANAKYKGVTATKEWLVRTAMATALPHEIKLSSNTRTLAYGVVPMMHQFGYGKPHCRVYRYWDENYPVTTSGAPVKTLTLHNRGRLLIVVGSFGEGGPVQIKLDRSALGLSSDLSAVDAELNYWTKFWKKRNQPARVQEHMAYELDIDSPEPGVFVFDIKKHNVAFLLIE